MNDIVQVIGVYKVHGRKDVHMIELIVHAPPKDIDIRGFTQENPNLPRSNWQVAYDEYYLDEDGKTVIGDWFNIPEHTGPTRLAFFLYFLDFSKPLLTPYGNVKLPKSSRMPGCLNDNIKFVDAD